jgi:hypothetical protein
MSDSGDAHSRARFERAFVSTRYLLGHRSDGLMQGLLARTSDSKRVALALTDGDRRQRALVLAAEWGNVVLCLTRRSFLKAGTR